VQAADVIVDALRGIRSAVRARTQIDRRRQSQRAQPARNDAAAALAQLYAAGWSNLLAEAECLDRSDQHDAQLLEDKIRAAGQVTAEDVQSCVEDFREWPFISFAVSK
jgi:phage host-nuclease inhibitor protein Gam